MLAALALGLASAGVAGPRAEAIGAVNRGAPATAGALPPSLRGREWERVPTRRRVVALTFDGGANAAGAPAILRALSRTRTPATFFLTGRFAETYPALARRIAARYPLGNHTFDHPHLTRLSDASVRREITQAERALRRITGRDPRPRFRFPYGDVDARTLAIVNRAGYGGIRWSVDTLGWEGSAGGQSAAGILRRVLAGLRPGEIVLMHLGAAPDRSTLDAAALPGIIGALRGRGYRLIGLGHLG